MVKIRPRSRSAPSNQSGRQSGSSGTPESITGLPQKKAKPRGGSKSPEAAQVWQADQQQTAGVLGVEEIGTREELRNMRDQLEALRQAQVAHRDKSDPDQLYQQLQEGVMATLRDYTAQLEQRMAQGAEITPQWKEDIQRSLQDIRAAVAARDSSTINGMT